MGQQVDLLKEFLEAGNPADQGGLDRVRLGSDEVVVYMFTSIAEKVDLHFCSEADINDYVLCNGNGCILCQIGRNLDQRWLMAVYMPEARAVAVLPVSLSHRPHALLPQLMDVLKIPEPQVVFIRRGFANITVLRPGRSRPTATPAKGPSPRSWLLTKPARSSSTRSTPRSATRIWPGPQQSPTASG